VDYVLFIGHNVLEQLAVDIGTDACEVRYEVCRVSL